jgi:hypothetical protein
MTTLVLLSRIFLWAAFLGGLTFVVAYSLTARWWRSTTGRTWMALVGAETILLGTGVWSLAFGDSPARRFIGLIAFGLFTATSWWRAVTLIRAQLRRDTARQPVPSRRPPGPSSP